MLSLQDEIEIAASKEVERMKAMNTQKEATIYRGLMELHFLACEPGEHASIQKSPGMCSAKGNIQPNYMCQQKHNGPRN